MMMGIIEFLNQVLQVAREGSFVEAIRLLPLEVQRQFVIDEVNRQDSNDFAFRALNDPTSGRGRGGFGQTGPTTLEEQARLVAQSAKINSTWPFAGL